jgi:hypothetical protein
MTCRIKCGYKAKCQSFGLLRELDMGSDFGTSRSSSVRKIPVQQNRHEMRLSGIIKILGVGGGIYKVSISRKVPIRLYHVTLNCQPPTKLDPGSGRSSPTFLRPTTFVYSTQICASTALVWLRYIPTSSMGVGIITSLAIITASIRGNKFTSFKLMFNQSNSSPDMS